VHERLQVLLTIGLVAAKLVRFRLNHVLRAHAVSPVTPFSASGACLVVRLVCHVGEQHRYQLRHELAQHGNKVIALLCPAEG
jgi:hypothetical protein